MQESRNAVEWGSLDPRRDMISDCQVNDATACDQFFPFPAAQFVPLAFRIHNSEVVNGGGA